MTARTGTEPVAHLPRELRPFEPDIAVPWWRDILAARHWRCMGTFLRAVVALLILLYGSGYGH